MTNHKFGFSAGRVHARVVRPLSVILTSSATIDMNVDKGEIFLLTPGETATINASGIKANVGQRVDLIITTSGSSSYTLTFGTNFLANGTLATGVTTAKKFVVSFVSNGTTLIEISRTTAL